MYEGISSNLILDIDFNFPILMVINGIFLITASGNGEATEKGGLPPYLFCISPLLPSLTPRSGFFLQIPHEVMQPPKIDRYLSEIQ